MLAPSNQFLSRCNSYPLPDCKAWDPFGKANSCSSIGIIMKFPIHIRIIMKFPIHLQLQNYHEIIQSALLTFQRSFAILARHVLAHLCIPCVAALSCQWRTFGLLYSVQLCGANSDSKFVQLKLRPIGQSSNDSSSLGLDCLNTTGEHQEHDAKKTCKTHLS